MVGLVVCANVIIERFTAIVAAISPTRTPIISNWGILSFPHYFIFLGVYYAFSLRVLTSV